MTTADDCVTQRINDCVALPQCEHPQVLPLRARMIRTRSLILSCTFHPYSHLAQVLSLPSTCVRSPRLDLLLLLPSLPAVPVPLHFPLPLQQEVHGKPVQLR